MVSSFVHNLSFTCLILIFHKAVHRFIRATTTSVVCESVLCSTFTTKLLFGPFNQPFWNRSVFSDKSWWHLINSVETETACRKTAETIRRRKLLYGKVFMCGLLKCSDKTAKPTKYFNVDLLSRVKVNFSTTPVLKSPIDTRWFLLRYVIHTFHTVMRFFAKRFCLITPADFHEAVYLTTKIVYWKHCWWQTKKLVSAWNGQRPL